MADARPYVAGLSGDGSGGGGGGPDTLGRFPAPTTGTAARTAAYTSWTPVELDIDISEGTWMLFRANFTNDTAMSTQPFATIYLPDVRALSVFDSSDLSGTTMYLNDYPHWSDIRLGRNADNKVVVGINATQPTGTGIRWAYSIWEEVTVSSGGGDDEGGDFIVREGLPDSSSAWHNKVVLNSINRKEYLCQNQPFRTDHPVATFNSLRDQMVSGDADLTIIHHSFPEANAASEGKYFYDTYDNTFYQVEEFSTGNYDYRHVGAAAALREVCHNYFNAHEGGELAGTTSTEVVYLGESHDDDVVTEVILPQHTISLTTKYYVYFNFIGSDFEILTAYTAANGLVDHYVWVLTRAEAIHPILRPLASGAFPDANEEMFQEHAVLLDYEGNGYSLKSVLHPGEDERAVFAAFESDPQAPASDRGRETDLMAWASGVAYKVGDRVGAGSSGGTYATVAVCVQAHTSTDDATATGDPDDENTDYDDYWDTVTYASRLHVPNRSNFRGFYTDQNHVSSPSVGHWIVTPHANNGVQFLRYSTTGGPLFGATGWFSYHPFDHVLGSFQDEAEAIRSIRHFDPDDGTRTVALISGQLRELAYHADRTTDTHTYEWVPGALNLYITRPNEDGSFPAASRRYLEDRTVLIDWNGNNWHVENVLVPGQTENVTWSDRIPSGNPNNVSGIPDNFRGVVSSRNNVSSPSAGDWVIERAHGNIWQWEVGGGGLFTGWYVYSPFDRWFGKHDTLAHASGVVHADPGSDTWCALVDGHLRKVTGFTARTAASHYLAWRKSDPDSNNPVLIYWGAAQSRRFETPADGNRELVGGSGTNADGFLKWSETPNKTHFGGDQFAFTFHDPSDVTGEDFTVTGDDIMFSPPPGLWNVFIESAHGGSSADTTLFLSFIKIKSGSDDDESVGGVAYGYSTDHTGWGDVEVYQSAELTENFLEVEEGDVFAVVMEQNQQSTTQYMVWEKVA